jgi:hypothetical protein
MPSISMDSVWKADSRAANWLVKYLRGLDSVLGGGATQTGPRGGRVPQSMTEKIVSSVPYSVASSVGMQIGSAIIRGVLGSILGGRR